MHPLDDPARHWVETVALPGRTVLGGHRLGGGYRNENLLLELDDGGRRVLRAQRDRGRAGVEAALALRLAGVAPVPTVLATDAERGLSLLEWVPGTPVDRLLPEVSAATMAGVGEAAGAALAAIGTVTFASTGFFTDESLIPSPLGLPSTLDEFVERCLHRAHPGWLLEKPGRDRLARLARRWALLVAEPPGPARLVHADFNPKNLLARPAGNGWVVTVLDWEFAFSGDQGTDLGNLLRFTGTDLDPAVRTPPPFAEGVLAGFARAGGELAPGWRERARALDLFALAEFLTRPPREPIAGAVRTVLRGLVAD